MLKNMDLIRELDEDMEVFCSHEYTEDNYKWAQ